MRPIQYLLIAFVLLAVIKVIQKYKQGGMHLLEFLFWTLIWIGAGVIIAFPETSQFLADLLGIGRGADLILYVGLTVAFYRIFRIHLTLGQVENEITEIVRAIALENLKGPGDARSGERGPSKEPGV